MAERRHGSETLSHQEPHKSKERVTCAYNPSTGSEGKKTLWAHWPTSLPRIAHSKFSEITYLKTKPISS